VIDSWAQYRSDILYGNTYDYGNFDQCMQINVKVNKDQIIGQYCLFQMESTSNRTQPRPPFTHSVNIEWKEVHKRFGAAICLPSSCPPHLAAEAINLFYKTSKLRVVEGNNPAMYCKSIDNIDKNQSAMLILFTITALLIGLSIAASYTSNKLLKAFSFRENFANLTKLEKVNPASIPTFDGLKAVASLAIIATHSTIFYYYYPPNASNNFKNEANGLISNVMQAFPLFLNVFFVTGGYFATKSLIKDFEK